MKSIFYPFKKYNTNLFAGMIFESFDIKQEIFIHISKNNNVWSSHIGFYSVWEEVESFVTLKQAIKWTRVTIAKEYDGRFAKNIVDAEKLALLV